MDKVGKCIPNAQIYSRSLDTMARAFLGLVKGCFRDVSALTSGRYFFASRESLYIQRRRAIPTIKI